MDAVSVMLYNLYYEQSLEGGGAGGLDTFAYRLKLAGEEFKSPKMMPPISVTADCHLHTQAAFAEAP